MNINVKCGVCGNDMAIHPSVSSTGLIEIVATCPSCKQMDKEIGDLEDRIFELEKRSKINA